MAPYPTRPILPEHLLGFLAVTRLRQTRKESFREPCRGVRTFARRHRAQNSEQQQDDDEDGWGTDED